MYVLGISGGFRAGQHESSAVLFENGKIVAAAEEERFIRFKHAPGKMPENAIRFCLGTAGITMKEVDVVGVNVANSKETIERVGDFLRFRFGYSPEVRGVLHYVAHAASVYRLSAFDDSLIMSADVSGDSVSTFIAHGKGKEIVPLCTIKRPNSLGLFYSMITQHLGFFRDNDEYKVMGLASYGKNEVDLSSLLKWGNGSYEFNYKDFMKEVGPQSPFPSKQEAIFSQKLIDLLGKPRLASEPIEQRHKDLAYSAQKMLERCVCDLLTYYHEKTGSRRVSIAGGVGLNCVMNHRIRSLTWVDDIIIQPASSDAGSSIGAAVEILAEAGIDLEPLKHVYLGPSFTDEEIEASLKSYGLKGEWVDDPSAYAAEQIADGKIIAWFQGRMEFGPRALGNRSILANPQDPDMKEKLNATIKFREDFRPFAPAVLEERAADCFEDGCSAPYMTMTFDVRDDWKKRLASITHIDGTARIQTVSKATNPLFHRLISAFEEITGIPVVINTSLNVKGQPICLAPRDAIWTFFGSGIDRLVMGHWVLKK